MQTKLPWTNREKEMMQIKTRLLATLKAYARRSKIQTEYYSILIDGPTGVGKSRMGYDGVIKAFEMLVEENQMIEDQRLTERFQWENIEENRVYLNFQVGDKIQLPELWWNRSRISGLRLAFQLSVSDPVQCRLPVHKRERSRIVRS